MQKKIKSVYCLVWFRLWKIYGDWRKRWNLNSVLVWPIKISHQKLKDDLFLQLHRCYQGPLSEARLTPFLLPIEYRISFKVLIITHRAVRYVHPSIKVIGKVIGKCVDTVCDRTLIYFSNNWVSQIEQNSWDRSFTSTASALRNNLACEFEHFSQCQILFKRVGTSKLTRKMNC